MKIFISMGMNSKSTEQVRVEMDKIFGQIAAKLPEAQLIESIIDGADSEIALHGDDMGMWYLGESVKLMAKADIVFFVDDYTQYRGCRVEKMVAGAYGKLCIEFESE